MSHCQQWKSCVPLFCHLFLSFLQHCSIWQHSTFAVQILVCGEQTDAIQMHLTPFIQRSVKSQWDLSHGQFMNCPFYFMYQEPFMESCYAVSLTGLPQQRIRTQNKCWKCLDFSLCWDEMAQPGIDSERTNPPSKTETSKDGHEEETVPVVETAVVAWFTIIHTNDCYKIPSQGTIFGSHVSEVILLILRRKEWKAEGNIYIFLKMQCQKTTNTVCKFKESNVEIFATTTAWFSSLRRCTPHCQQQNKF